MISRHRPLARMERHRHSAGYAAVVLSGGYVEAGSGRRLQVDAGTAVIHAAYEAHRDEFGTYGAVVLNLPLPDGMKEGPVRVPDVDEIARLAEHDPGAAAALLKETACPSEACLDDWPDALASALVRGTDAALADWADENGLAPQSLSRGFRRAYGVSPKRYRAEQRALKALRLFPTWHGSLAELAIETGFSDQAHMTRLIGEVAGMPPRRLKVHCVQEGARCRS